MPTVLLVDDDVAFAEELALYLREHGFATVVAADAVQAAAALQGTPVDLVLLDQKLGGESGIDVLRRIRAFSSVPCIILTGAGDQIERIVALEVGADDYLTKGTQGREIVARARALLRRASPQMPRETPSPSETGRPPSGGWCLSEQRRELYRPDGTPCDLTTAEFEVLRLLVKAQGVPLAREEICRLAFNRPYRVGDRGVDMVVVKLRRKLEQNPHDPEVLKAVRPYGYVFTGFPERAPSPRRDLVIPSEPQRADQ